MPLSSSPVGSTGALRGVDNPPLSHSSSLHQQRLEAQQRFATQSLGARGRASSTPPQLHQRGRTRTREDNRVPRARSHSPEPRPFAATDPVAPTSEQTLMHDMELHQHQLMERQMKLQTISSNYQAAMLEVKTAADMTKLMSDTLAEITNGFMDSAKKVMEKGGDAMKLR